MQNRLLKPADADAALRETRGRDRVEDVLLNMGVVGEADLLKCLASHFKVQFISTEKLARVDVQRALVNTLPRRVADAIGLCPRGARSEDERPDRRHGRPRSGRGAPRGADGVGRSRREAGPGSARRPCRALIAKTYGGDAHAFTTLEREAQNYAASSLQHNSIALDDDPRGAAWAAAATAEDGC